MRWKVRLAGFSLLELMIVVAIIGILARLAIPRYRAFTAEARRGEARVNLKSIHTYQEAYMIAHNVYWGPKTGQSMREGTKYGYDNGSTWRCDEPTESDVVIATTGAVGKKLGFKFKSTKECQEMRYGYEVNASTGDFIARAHGGHDQTNWLYEQCVGKDSGSAGGVAINNTNCAIDSAAVTARGLTAVSMAADANGDALCIGSEKPLQVTQDIIEACK